MRVSTFTLYAILALSLTACTTEDEQKKQNKPDDNSIVKLELPATNIKLDEGEPGIISSFDVTFKLIGNLKQNASLSYHLVDDTALAGEHYIREQELYTVDVSAGDKEVKAKVQVIGNDEYNKNRYFSLVLVEAEGIALPNKKVVSIEIANTDAPPVVVFNTDFLIASPNVGTLSIELKQNKKSDFNSTLDISFGGLAQEGVRYTTSLEQGKAQIPAGSLSSRFELNIINDGIPRGSENIELRLSNAQHSSVGEAGALDVVVQGVLGLPDTGVKKFYNAGDFTATAPDADHLYQDAEYGRDVDHNADSLSGYAGLSYTKLDLSGNPLPDTSDDFHCIKDDLTGLVWERKFANANGGRITPADTDTHTANRVFFRYVNDQYMWHNTTKLNGGNAGGTNRDDLKKGKAGEGEDPWVEGAFVSAGGHCQIPSNKHIYAGTDRYGCTTSVYIDVLNKSGACGFSDWRVPEINELSTLAVYDGGESRLDTKFLLNPAPTNMRSVNEKIRYWSNTPASDNEAAAWCFDLETGNRMFCQKNGYQRLISVRGGQL